MAFWADSKSLVFTVRSLSRGISTIITDQDLGSGPGKLLTPKIERSTERVCHNNLTKQIRSEFVTLKIFTHSKFGLFSVGLSKRQNDSVKTRAPKFYIPFIHQAGSPTPPHPFSALIFSSFENISAFSF